MGVDFKFGVACYIYGMFLRKLKNRSGSVSVQIISKSTGKYKVLKTIGSSSDEQEVQKLVYLANQEIERISQQSGLFISESDTIVEQVFSSLNNASIRTVGPEIIFGKICDKIGLERYKRNFSTFGFGTTSVSFEQVKNH